MPLKQEDVENMNFDELLSSRGMNYFESGRIEGWREAGKYLLEKSGEAFSQEKDMLAKQTRDCAKLITERQMKIRDSDIYSYEANDELVKRVDKLHEVKADIEDILSNCLDSIPPGENVSVDSLRKWVKEDKSFPKDG